MTDKLALYENQLNTLIDMALEEGEQLAHVLRRGLAGIARGTRRRSHREPVSARDIRRRSRATYERP